MLKYYTICDDSLCLLTNAEIKKDSTNSVWIDIFNPIPEEEKIVENYLQKRIFNLYQMAPVDNILSPHYQRKGGVYVKAFIISDNKSPIQDLEIILTNDKVITLRDTVFHSFQEYLNYVTVNKVKSLNHNSIFINLLESTINYIEDSLEKIASSIDEVSYITFYAKKSSSPKIRKKKINFTKLIDDLGVSGDLISKNYESLLSIHRALTFIAEMRPFKMSEKELKRVESLLEDISRLEEEVSIMTDKTNFLLDVCLGMINIEQNLVTKIVSIAALIFLPPAIIPSIYGMNFINMPELKWHYGFPYAITLIVLSGILPYLYCKFRKWL